jgi:hypothetical protein
MRVRGGTRPSRQALVERAVAPVAPGRAAASVAPAYSFRARQVLLFGLLLLRRAWRCWAARCTCSCSITLPRQSRAMRASRASPIIAHRGNITDRNGEPLAVSTPVQSVWVNPQDLSGNLEQLPRLAAALGVDRAELTRHVSSNLNREFLYLARGMSQRCVARQGS